MLNYLQTKRFIVYRHRGIKIPPNNMIYFKQRIDNVPFSRIFTYHAFFLGLLDDFSPLIESTLDQINTNSVRSVR